jgi:hypothetical protein
VIDGDRVIRRESVIDRDPNGMGDRSTKLNFMDRRMDWAQSGLKTCSLDKVYRVEK